MPEDTKAQIIPADAAYYVDVICPHCRESVLVPLTLLAKLDRTRDESKLGVKAAQKKVDHTCGQTSLTVVAESREIIQLDMGDR